MAKTLTSKLQVNLSWNYKNVLDLQSPADARALKIADTLLSGTAINTADLMFADRRSMVASANDDLDLSGSLVDAFGATLAFAKIVGIVIHNRNTAVGDVLVVGGDGTAGFHTWLKDSAVDSEDGIRIGPDGVFLLWNPSLAAYAVTNSTADKLRITEGGGANAGNYDIVLIGRSA